jgi:hypothetical protein
MILHYWEENEMRVFGSFTMLEFIAELLVPGVSEYCTAFKGKEHLDPRGEVNTVKHRFDNLE